MRVPHIWVTHAELAEYIGMSGAGIAGHRKRGNLKFERLNGREYVSHVNWANDWIEKQGYDAAPIRSNVIDELEWLSAAYALANGLHEDRDQFPEDAQQTLEALHGLMGFGLRLFAARIQPETEGTSFERILDEMKEEAA